MRSQEERRHLAGCPPAEGSCRNATEFRVYQTKPSPNTPDLLVKTGLKMHICTVCLKKKKNVVVKQRKCWKTKQGHLWSFDQIQIKNGEIQYVFLLSTGYFIIHWVCCVSKLCVWRQKQLIAGSTGNPGSGIQCASREPPVRNHLWCLSSCSFLKKPLTEHTLLFPRGLEDVMNPPSFPAACTAIISRIQIRPQNRTRTSRSWFFKDNMKENSLLTVWCLVYRSFPLLGHVNVE